MTLLQSGKDDDEVMNFLRRGPMSVVSDSRAHRTSGEQRKCSSSLFHPEDGLGLNLKKKNQTIKGTHRGCHGSYNDGKWQDHHKPRISSKKASTSTSRPFNCGTGSVGGAQN